ncbi:MAG TPA: hypothetical protein VI298_09975 [Geobacteraceae bacterium]
MHVASRFVPLQDAAQFENDLRSKGYVLADKITEELQPGEYLKLSVDAPESYSAGGITFAWKE